MSASHCHYTQPRSFLGPVQVMAKAAAGARSLYAVVAKAPSSAVASDQMAEVEVEAEAA